MIIPLDKSHFEEIMSVWEDSVRGSHAFIREEDIAIYKPLIHKGALHQFEFWGIQKKGKLAGFMGLSADKIAMLFLRPDFIGQGLGRQLIEFATQEKKKKYIDVNEENLRALGCYQHMGFEVIGRDEKDDCGRPHPVLYMQLKPAKKTPK